MAEIVVFSDWRQARSRRPEIRIGERKEPQRGQILLFTGIRYESLDIAPAQPAAPDTAPMLEQT